MIRKIALVGAGNLATQLGIALKKTGFDIVQVYSRTEKSAMKLAVTLGCPFTSSLNDMKFADLIIVSVKDDALKTILEHLRANGAIVVHTAGSVPMEMLANCTQNYGVFYPLQTFSKGRNVHFSDIPICLEASSPKIFDELRVVAGRLSETVRAISSEERRILHLAAVFTCNFVNHLYHLGDHLLQENDLEFDLLKPLIRETAEKVMTMKPAEAQTGPAVRFDETIINKHLNLLTDHPELKKIYSFVSESIYKTHKNS